MKGLLKHRKRGGELLKKRIGCVQSYIPWGGGGLQVLKTILKVRQKGVVSRERGGKGIYHSRSSMEGDRGIGPLLKPGDEQKGVG